MSFADFFSNLKRYDKNANVIFDHEEPVGRATDLVMPRPLWFRRKPGKSAPSHASVPNDR